MGILQDKLYITKNKEFSRNIERNNIPATNLLKNSDSKHSITFIDDLSPKLSMVNTQKIDFLQQEEKEWMNNELAIFINTL